MQSIRAFGLLVLWGMGVGFGIWKKYAIGKRARLLQQFWQTVRLLEVEIRTTALPIREILQKHQSTSAQLQYCLQKMEDGLSFGAAWNQLVQLQGVCTKEDRAYLLEFGNTFGKADLQAQLESCQYLEQQLEQQRQQALCKQRQKGNLYPTLGILCSTGVVLLLL